jgi:hypothetical protein
MGLKQFMFSGVLVLCIPSISRSQNYFPQNEKNKKSQWDSNFSNKDLKANSLTTGDYQKSNKYASTCNTVLALGLASTVAGYALKQPILVIGGGLSGAIAFPLLGVNASNMGRYLESRNQNFDNPWTGWLFYGGGFATGLAGSWLLSSGNSDYNNRFDANGVEDKEAGKLKVSSGTVLLVSGIILNSTAFILFERKVFECKTFFEELSISPTIINESGRISMGLALKLELSDHGAWLN